MSRCLPQLHLLPASATFLKGLYPTHTHILPHHLMILSDDFKKNIFFCCSLTRVSSGESDSPLMMCPKSYTFSNGCDINPTPLMTSRQTSWRCPLLAEQLTITFFFYESFLKKCLIRCVKEIAVLYKTRTCFCLMHTHTHLYT